MLAALSEHTRHRRFTWSAKVTAVLLFRSGARPRSLRFYGHEVDEYDHSAIIHCFDINPNINPTKIQRKKSHAVAPLSAYLDK